MSTSINDCLAAHGQTPRHVAIIMDGNNRWAKQRHLPGVAGHRAGVKAVRAVVEVSARQGVEVLTLFAFSSENWRRPEAEVSALMQLFLSALQRQVKHLHEHNIRLIVMGDLSRFTPKIQQAIEAAQQLTEHNSGLTLVVAANYGGQWDIASAAKRIALDVQAGRLRVDDIDEQRFHQYTWLHQFPAPDLLIRTGGEQRISNFMLWQSAYTELYFSDAYWPDFKQQEYQNALAAFAERTRRFGRTDAQLKKDAE